MLKNTPNKSNFFSVLSVNACVSFCVFGTVQIAARNITEYIMARLVNFTVSITLSKYLYRPITSYNLGGEGLCFTHRMNEALQLNKFAATPEKMHPKTKPMGLPAEKHAKA